MNAGRWPLERVLFALAGTVTLASALLAALVSPWFLLLTAFVGLNQWLYVAFGACPASLVLGAAAFGFRERMRPVTPVGPIGRLGRWTATTAGSSPLALGRARDRRSALSRRESSTRSRAPAGRRPARSRSRRADAGRARIRRAVELAPDGRRPSPTHRRRPRLPQARRRVEELLTGERGVASVVPPRPGVSISRDGHTAVVQAAAAGSPTEMVRAADELKGELAAAGGDGVDVTLTGASGMWSDFNHGEPRGDDEVGADLVAGDARDPGARVRLARRGRAPADADDPRPGRRRRLALPRAPSSPTSRSGR